MSTEPPRPAPPARRFAELEKSHQRRAVFRTTATVAVAWVLIFGAYYLLPFDHGSSLRAVLRIGACIALVGGVLVWQIGRIASAELPELRAVEALGIVIALFLAAFAAIYLGMSHAGPATFSQRLDHTRALYFTITVFSTVGFGDIVPRTDTARLLVAAQMLLDLAIIGAVVRLILNAAKNRVAPSDGPAPGATPGPSSGDEPGLVEENR
jgi:voltage-gated potassium channel